MHAWPAILLEETLAQVFSYEFYGIFKNTFFTKHLRTNASWQRLNQRSFLTKFRILTEHQSLRTPGNSFLNSQRKQSKEYVWMKGFRQSLKVYCYANRLSERKCYFHFSTFLFQQFHLFPTIDNVSSAGSTCTTIIRTLRHASVTGSNNFISHDQKEWLNQSTSYAVNKGTKGCFP